MNENGLIMDSLDGDMDGEKAGAAAEVGSGDGRDVGIIATDSEDDVGFIDHLVVGPHRS